MGKTHLTQQVGQRLLDQAAAHFPDGICFLSLAAVDAGTFRPALNPLVNGLAGLFGLRLHDGTSPQEQLLAYLQQAAVADHRLGRGLPAALHHFRRYAVLLAAGNLAETAGDLLAAQQAFTEIWQYDQEHLPPPYPSSHNWKPRPRPSKLWPGWLTGRCTRVNRNKR